MYKAIQLLNDGSVSKQFKYLEKIGVLLKRDSMRFIGAYLIVMY